jgi:hypothetical protein
LRWVSFIIGLLTFSDPDICAGYLTYQPRPPEQLGGFLVAHIPGADYETDADGISISRDRVNLRLEYLEPDAMPSGDDSPESQLADVFAPRAGQMVVHSFTLGDPERDTRPVGRWLSATYVADTPDVPGFLRIGLVRFVRADNGEGLFVHSYADDASGATIGDPEFEALVGDMLALGYATENFLCLPGQSAERGSAGYYFACDIEVPE